MKQPYLSNLPGKQRIPINEFLGVNTGVSPLLIGEGQAEDMKNLDTRDFPLLKTRASRRHITALSGIIRHLGSVLGETLTALEDNTWKMYNFETNTWSNIGTLSGNGQGMSIEFVNQTIYVNGTANRYRSHDNKSMGSHSNMPPVSALAIANSKLYGIEENKLHHGGIRLPNLWDDGEESGYIVVETSNGEKLSAITEFSGHIICFKPHSMHKLFGSYYLDHHLQTVSDSIGCVSQRSLCKVKTKLIWLGDGAVYSYDTGVMPVDISMSVKKYLENTDNVHNACAGTDGERYYLSLPQRDGHVMLVYDTRIGEWMVEDDIPITEFAQVKNKLYGVTSDGGIYQMISEEVESFDWYWHSKWFAEKSPSMKQNWFSLYITLETALDSEFFVEVVNNKGLYKENLRIVHESGGHDGKKVIRVLIPPSAGHNAEWLQVRLRGKGYCKIHNLEREIRTKRGSY